ncbi:MAG: hypothetical protein Q7S00_01425, partial [bacterium]|nr:hypothetical protein [bacterium]
KLAMQDGEKKLVDLETYGSNSLSAPPVALRNLLERLVILLAPQLAGKIQVRRNYETLPAISVPVPPLIQLLRILLAETIAAMSGDGGHLYLTLKKKEGEWELGLQGDAPVRLRQKNREILRTLQKELGLSVTQTRPEKGNLFLIRRPL